MEEPTCLEHSEIVSPTVQISDTLINDLFKEDKQLRKKKKSMPEPTEDNWQEILNFLRIDLAKSYAEEPICIAIIENNEKFRFGTLGNFSLITGKAKSRKTYLISLLLGSALSDNVYQNKLLITLAANRNRIVLFDTEQSDFDVWKVAKRVLSLVRYKGMERFEAIPTRILTLNGRLKLLEQIIYNYDDLGILVIDGIRDLVKDINSSEEATNISGKLLRWSQERNIHILTVLHQNKNDNNTRGHLGTELNNKAEIVISVEKEGETSTVKPVYSRGKDFAGFRFGIVDDLPLILDGQVVANKESKKEKTDPSKCSAELHKEILKEIYAEKKSYRYGELKEKIGIALKAKGMPYGENKQKEFLTYYSEKFLQKQKIPGYKFDGYILNQSV